MVKKIKKVSREVVRDKKEDVVRKSKATRKKEIEKKRRNSDVDGLMTRRI